MFMTLLGVQIALSLGIISAIILQPQGTGLGNAWGGGGETYHTRRGIERILFIATIVLSVLFTLNGLALLVLQ